MQIQDSTTPLYGRILNRLRYGKGKTLSSEKKKHICSHETCLPQSEIQMIDLHLLDAPAVSNNVYLCVYGCVHICSDTSCGLYEHTPKQICPISGIQWRQTITDYNRDDSRTWYSRPNWYTSNNRNVPDGHIDDDPRKKKKIKTLPVPLVPKKPKKKWLSECIVKERTRDLITLLLYSDRRKDRNNAAILERFEIVEKSKQTYIQQRFKRQQLPYLYDLIRIRAMFTSKPLPYILYEMDLSRIEYYTCVVYQAWEYVMSYVEANTDSLSLRPDIKVVAIGVLYLMRGGHKINGIEVLPSDDFLQTSLPLINDLTYFDVPKKNVTRGVTLVTDAYKFQKRPAEDLVLDVSRLPLKNMPNGLTKLTSRRT